MITKLASPPHSALFGSVLAKIHMVTKPLTYGYLQLKSSVLAKIHMVTKHAWN